MRVLLVGDLAATGFGTVTMDLGRELLKLGQDLRFLSQNDLTALPEPFISRTLEASSVIQGMNYITGEAGAVAMSKLPGMFRAENDLKLANKEPWGDWIPEAVIMLGDIQSVRFHVIENPEYLQVPLRFHYVPIEGTGISPLIQDDLWKDITPVAMSNFGADEIAKATGTRPPMIYHGVDSNAFAKVKPSNPITIAPDGAKSFQLRTRDDCKTMFGHWFRMPLPAMEGSTKEHIIHSSKWMLRTDRHMPRKLYNTMLRGLVPVLYENPEALIVLHCNSQDQGGFLPDSIRKLPGAQHRAGQLEPGKPDGYSLFGREYVQVVITNRGGAMPRDVLRALYNAADLYVSTSAEGFGLTIAEALACGTPVVGLDYSAVPEVIGPAGVLVPPAYEFDNQYDHFWAAVDEERFAETVHALLNDPEKRERLGRKGPRHVRSSFRWDTAARQFADLLQPAALSEAA